MTGPDIKTALPGPRAKALIERDRSVVSPSYTRCYPLVIERGSGAFVEDVDGNIFLDCAAGIAVNSTGHSHPAVVTAITDQAQKFLHMSGTDFYYEPQVRLAEEMAAIAPISGGVRTFFGNSGTEVVEACVKLARYTTGRQNIIAFLGGFHGRTMGSLALTASKAVQRRGFGPLMPGVYHAPYADCYRCPLGLNPETCAAECLGFIDDQLFAHLVTPDEVAAIVVEPIQGEGGYVVAPEQFLQRLRELTQKHGILLVADEVQSGMGRSGRMFAIEFSGVEPDMIAIAKGIASGMPLGVAVARKGVMEWPPGTHASTFGGNPVSCAAGIATLDVFEREGILENAREKGEQLLGRLRELQTRVGAIGDVRGLGLMIGVELVEKNGKPDKHLQKHIRQICLDSGLVILSCGTEDNVLRLVPPLNISESELNEGWEILSAAFHEAAA